MKKFTFKGVLDGIRSSVKESNKYEAEIEELLRPDLFHVAKTVRHGFPYQPTAMAYDPIQKLLAIGTKTGSLRIFGRPGVDAQVNHEGDNAILQIIFLINEGALITVCSDDSLHLWNLRQKIPEVVHSLRFQKERITFSFLPFQSKFIYIGTEKGNVHVANIESFVLSGYIISWNKAMELSSRTHPGAVVHISDNPLDANKLLIGFDQGTIVLWDLRLKVADLRCQCSEPLRSVSWHNEGKQFMCSHSDGSLTTWHLRAPGKAFSVVQPHVQVGKDGKMENCRSIPKVEWKAHRSGEPYIVFSGGLCCDRGGGRTPSITVIHGKVTTVLEMEHNVVDFIVLCDTPWQCEIQDPHAIVVLLHNDLVVIDLNSQGYMCFENPYPMDLHESPVTCCTYVSNCPSDLIPAFYSVGSRSLKRTGFTDKEWPINGGNWGSASCSYAEMIITGHADGSLKFWDASAVSLMFLYKLKTSKIFDKAASSGNKAGPSGIEGEEDPLAIHQISLCPESRMLCVAGASAHVMLFKFCRHETSAETIVLEIPIIYEVDDNVACSPDYEYPPRPSLSGANAVYGANMIYGAVDDKKPSLDMFIPLRVRSGVQRKAAGFQCELVCLTPWSDGEQPGQITSLSINSSYMLMSYGNDSGLVVVDMLQKTVLLTTGTPDLYGTADPYQRIPRSPRRTDNLPGPEPPDRCKSPSIDQINGLCLSPTSSASTPRSHPQPLPPSVTGSTAGVAASSSGFGSQATSSSVSSVPARVRACREQGQVPELKRAKSQDKIDSNFSRSRSSSMSSLENIASEAIQCLVFADSYTRKNEPTTCPTLWVGTNLGSVLVIMLNIPVAQEARSTQPGMVSPSGTIFRLKGAILALAFLDCNGALIRYQYETWKDPNKLDAKQPPKNERARSPNKAGANADPNTKISPTASSTNVSNSGGGEEGAYSMQTGSGDRQFVVMCSEKQARVVALPSHTCAYKQQITETSTVVKADITSMKSSFNLSAADSVCLVAYLANGHIVAYSLPSLRPILDVDFVPVTDLRIARTFCFTNYGHGLYRCSPSEIQKFSISSEYLENLKEMLGDLFLPCEAPEPPKEGFLKGLFGGGRGSLDRDELFGEASGKPRPTLANRIPGSANVEQLSTKATGIAGDIARTRQALNERGEGLGRLEDKSEKMMVEAEVFGSSAHQLMLKQRDKKWYQF